MGASWRRQPRLGLQAIPAAYLDDGGTRRQNDIVGSLCSTLSHLPARNNDQQYVDDGFYV